MKISINDGCSACGICEDICPEVFVLGDEKSKVKVNPVPEQYQQECVGAEEETIRKTASEIAVFSPEILAAGHC